MSILNVDGLSVKFTTEYGDVKAVRDVSLKLEKGEIMALVGESGCGKTVLCRSIMRLLPGTAEYTTGSISLGEKNLLKLNERQMTKVRGGEIAMIFQDPQTSLDPCMSVGAQIAETVRLHDRKASRKSAKIRAVELMKTVGIPDAEKRYSLFPQHFSGGMRQRIVIAAALASNPKILLADEPTTALDVTTQAQIIDLLKQLKKTLDLSVIFVTHDLGVVARVADRVSVMYAGKIIETGTTDDIFFDPRHPYTQGLLKAVPSRGRSELFSIEGMPPSLINVGDGDAFAARNPKAMAIDFIMEPPMFKISETHYAATWLLDARAKAVSDCTSAEPEVRYGA